MSNQNCLALRLVRLKPADEWINKSVELCFVFPQTGGGKYTSRMAIHQLAAGDVLALHRASGGRISASSGGEFAFWSFTACLEHLFPLFETDEISRLRNVTDDLKATKLYAASGVLAKQCHRLLADAPPQFDLDHRSQMLRVVAAILTVEFKNTHAQRGGFVRMEVHMVQVFEKLSSEEILNLSVGELAHKFSCSRRHLNRLFHQHFGFSMASLRMEMRLLKAVSLLRDPDTKIINVAEGCGFNHLGLFNTCFKRRFGKSPGEWRKTNSDSEISQPIMVCVANHLRAKGIDSRNGKLETSGSSLDTEPSRKTNLPVVLKTRASPEKSKPSSAVVSGKARESLRRLQVV